MGVVGDITNRYYFNKMNQIAVFNRMVMFLNKNEMNKKNLVEANNNIFDQELEYQNSTFHFENEIQSMIKSVKFYNHSGRIGIRRLGNGGWAKFGTTEEDVCRKYLEANPNIEWRKNLALDH